MQPNPRFAHAIFLSLLLGTGIVVLVALLEPGEPLRTLLAWPRSSPQVLPAQAPLPLPPAAAVESAQRADEHPAVERSPTPTATPLQVRGQLSDEASGLPLADHTVVLAWHLTDDPPRRAEAKTAANGQFELSLPPAYWIGGRYYSAQVLDPQGIELMRGLVLLTREIVLSVAPRPLLRGRLETYPEIAYSSVLLRVWTPPAQALDTQLLCGETHLEADGSFSLRVDEPVASDEILLVFSNRMGGFADATLPRMILAADLAPKIVRELTTLVLDVVDEEGNKLPGAHVRVFPAGEAGSIRWNILTSPAEGRLELQLQEGDYELCAGLSGYRPLVERLHLEGAEPAHPHLLKLARLRPEDRISGHLYARDGSPVEGALVQARPHTIHAELGRPGLSESWSDALGHFELPASPTCELLLRAAHPAHGVLELGPLSSADSPFALHFQALGSIEVTPSSTATASPISAGPMQYFLVERGGERITSGYSNGCPWRIEDVVAGEYDIYLMAHGQVGYAEAQVRVSELRQAVVEAAIAPASELVGILLDRDGNPQPNFELQLLHPYWPARMIRAWATVTTAMDGTFRLFAGNLREFHVRVLRGEEELYRTDAFSGGPVTIRLP